MTPFQEAAATIVSQLTPPPHLHHGPFPTNLSTIHPPSFCTQQNNINIFQMKPTEKRKHKKAKHQLRTLQTSPQFDHIASLQKNLRVNHL